MFVTEFESLLVIREWPGGEVTAYTRLATAGAAERRGLTLRSALIGTVDFPARVPYFSPAPAVVFRFPRGRSPFTLSHLTRPYLKCARPDRDHGGFS